MYSLSRDPAPALVTASALAPALVTASALAPAPAQAPTDHDHEYNPDEFDYSSEEIEPSDDEGPPNLRVKRSDYDTEASETPSWRKRSEDDNDAEANETPTWSKRRNDNNDSRTWRKRSDYDNDGEVIGDNDVEDNNDEDGDKNLTIDDAADWGYGSENEDDETLVPLLRRHHDDGHHHHHHHHQTRCHDMKTSCVRMPTSWKRDVMITVPNMKGWKCGQDKTRLINLKPYGKIGGREYNIIVEQMNKTKRYQPRMKFKSYNIIKIQRVVNGCFWKRYKRRQEDIKIELGYRNERMLFHGTNKVKELLEFGFDERHASMKNLFGPGIYFARHSSKCNQYVFGNFKPCPPHGDVNCDICERKILLCRVTLGKVMRETKADKRYNPPPGYHSVMGLPSNGFLKYDEFVIYRGEQVYPEYVITYKIVK